MRSERTAVLVVGGSLVGLSAGVFLAWRGVPVVVVERHAGSSIHPKAIGYTPRTVELLRAVGLGDRVPAAPGGALGGAPRRVRTETLLGEWSPEIPWSPPTKAEPDIEYSPCRGAGLAQDKLEPLLRERAAELGADVRMSTELLSFAPDAAEVRAVVRGPDGQEYEIVADYLIAADGHRSPIRERLGIGRQGRGFIHVGRSVLFRAPLDELLPPEVRQFEVEQPGFRCFVTTYGDGRWVLFFDDTDHEPGEPELRAMITRAVGRDDLPIELITTGRWEISALYADRFRAGRVFLAGDAAHTLPPNRGAYGVNTGIEDAHNLAWKLAAVRSGESGLELLDTYEQERRPIAELCHQQLFARVDWQGADAPADAPTDAIVDDLAMAFGLRYRSTAVLGGKTGLPLARRPEEWLGEPGTRVRHLWVVRDGDRLSTVDLLQWGWVVLTEDARWREAGERAAAELGLALEVVVFGDDVRTEEPGSFGISHGIGATGAVLARPDGYIGWRSVEFPYGDPAATLIEALGAVAHVERTRSAAR